MNIYSKILLLSCLVSSASMIVLDFKQLLYHEICEPEIIEFPEDYEASEIFNQMFRKISIR